MPQTVLGLNIVSDLRLRFIKKLAEELYVTQSGLTPVVSQWDKESAAMCRQIVPVLTT